MFASGDSDTVKAAQATLYRALEIGLRILSPFMPFITEELYQRLPRSTNLVEAVPSICIAAYPEIDNYSWRNEIIESEFGLIQKIAKAIRSARSDYNLPNKTKTEGNNLQILSIN